jgi:hypothetical protein
VPTTAPQAAQATAATPPTRGQHLPELAATYIGISDDCASGPACHLVMLDVQAPCAVMTWAKAMAWAESLGNGARLPTQAEAMLAHANLGDCLGSGYYWTSTQFSRFGAFVQDFEYGISAWYGKDYEHRVRAFRGLPLEHFNTSTPAQVVADADAAPGGAEGAGANFLASAGVAA